MIALLPFALQALIMGVDEIYCHRRRTLGKWERIGHPADTAVFGLCFLWLILSDRAGFSLAVYGALATASCLLITKDEWQHRELSSGFENWLHALLFILHPVVLISAWFVNELSMLVTMFIGSMAFFIYQAVYWNWWRRGQQ